MDPFSLAIGVLTILGAATHTHKALLALYNLRNAPQEALELINEVNELQTLLHLIEKATRNILPSSLTFEDQESIKRLVESAREPLSLLDRLITACSRNTDQNAVEREARFSLSFTTWLRSRKSIEKIKNKFLRAQRNINTALVALGNIQHQGDSKLILNIHELILNQTKETEAQASIRQDELIMYRQFSRAVVGETESQPDAAVISKQGSSTTAQYNRLDPPSNMESVEDRLRVTDKEKEALDGHSDTQDPNEAFCHPRRVGESPRWLAELLGALFYSHTGIPFLRLRSCNYSACIQRESASYQLTYHFPRWMIKRAFIFTASYRDLCGVAASWSIGFPRTISASHKTWQFIERCQFHEFSQLLRERLILGNDMADDDGTSLLIYALKFRSHKIVGLLLEYGANPHMVDPRGISALAYAQSSLLIDRPCQRPSWSAQIDLTTNEPNVTDDLCFTPLHHVVTGLEQADLRQQLRINKIPIDTPDSFGRSLLHWAVIMGNSVAVEVLLEHRASPTCVDKEKMTPLHDIFLAPPSSQSLSGRSLLDAEAEVDAFDFWGRTPLRIAVGYTNISLDFLDILIHKGADVNRRDIYSQSPLLKSIQGRKETTQLLLHHGADMEAQDEFGNTPVLEAIYRNKPEQFRMLLEHGAKIIEPFELKPGRRARDGQIHLLDFIIWYGSVEIMRVLEDSARQHYHLSHPLDTFEQYREFRLANGRKARAEEHEAFNHLLSHVKRSREGGLQSSISEVKGDHEERFVDAHEHI